MKKKKTRAKDRIISKRSGGSFPGALVPAACTIPLSMRRLLTFQEPAILLSSQVEWLAHTDTAHASPTNPTTPRDICVSPLALAPLQWLWLSLSDYNPRRPPGTIHNPSSLIICVRPPYWPTLLSPINTTHTHTKTTLCLHHHDPQS